MKSLAACDPPLRGSIRDTGHSRHGLQGTVLLQVRLDYAESIQRQLADIFGQTGKEVHPRKVRQIVLTILRQIMVLGRFW